MCPGGASFSFWGIACKGFLKIKLCKLCSLAQVKHGVAVKDIVEHVLRAWSAATGKPIK